MLPSSNTYAKWLAVLRIYTGAFWLIHGLPKFLDSTSFMPPSGIMSMLIAKSVAASSGPYHDFLLSTVTPNIMVFANLVRFGEVLVGISLVLGLLSRFGGLFGVILALNYFLAKGSGATIDGYAGLDFAAIALSFIHLVLPTGLVWGMDTLFPRNRRFGKGV